MSNDDFFSDEPPRVLTDYARGGARPNSGPKKGHRSATDETPHEKLTDYQRKERAAADKEEQLARQARVKADLDEGSVVPIQAVADAAARAFSACSQSLDAIPDILERKGVPIEVAQTVGELINAAKSQLAAKLESLHERPE